MDKLFESPGAPYFIVSPPYTEKSAGVKVLHMLCHALNVRSRRAYMVRLNTPPQGGETYCSDLVSPQLGSKARVSYESAGIDPIVIYPDIVSGNPLSARHVMHTFSPTPATTAETNLLPARIKSGGSRRGSPAQPEPRMCCSSPSGTRGSFIRPMIAIAGRGKEDVSTPGSGSTFTGHRSLHHRGLARSTASFHCTRWPGSSEKARCSIATTRRR